MTEEQIFRYLRGEASEKEKEELDRWLADSDENVRRYRFARFVFEGIAMHSAPEKRRARTAGKSRILRHAAIFIGSAAAAVAIFFVSAHMVRTRIDRELSETFAVVEVPAGQRMDLKLADGTVVKLNSGAVLRYPALFPKDVRNVSLSGEAYFDVARDETRPFTVRTFATDVKVLGTEFNLAADENSGTFAAMLVEGSVELVNRMNPEETLVMKPDDKVHLENGHLRRAGKYGEYDLCWTEGLVSIKGYDFVQLMEKLELAYGVEIEIVSGNVPELSGISGELRISDGIDHALSVLRHVTDFTYTRDSRTGKISIRAVTP